MNRFLHLTKPSVMDESTIWYECLYCEFRTIQYDAMVQHIDTYHKITKIEQISKKDVRLIGEKLG